MTQASDQAAAVALSVDHLFRRQAGRMVATLTRILGVRNLDLVEDAVQDALVQALKQWPFYGVPENPSAWIVTVAKNRALDLIRRRQSWVGKSRELLHQLERLPTAGADDDVAFGREVRDDQLQLVFVCCHPALSRDSQVALTLNLVGGFSTEEVARAFLARRVAMAQRLVRAKRRLRDEDVRFGMPADEAMAARLDAVLEVLYLMFNEGYGAHQGEELVRHDLCREAIRLTLAVCDHPVVGAPKADALAALLLFQGSRLETRVDAEGDLLLMAEQDRSRWDRSMQRQAALFLARAGRGEKLSTYHLEAEIAACHALAPDYESTDWRRILDCYDALEQRNPSPVVRLNRLVAQAEIEGAATALESSRALAEGTLADYYPAHILHGELLCETGHHEAAAEALRRALELASSVPVRRHIERRLEALAS